MKDDVEDRAARGEVAERSERFTPGPWRLKFEPPTPDYEYPYARIGAGQEYSGDGFELSGIITHADARLIAAAPDLFDLALNVGGTDGRLLVAADLNTLRATLREFIDQARAALAKARGTTL